MSALHSTVFHGDASLVSADGFPVSLAKASHAVTAGPLLVCQMSSLSLEKIGCSSLKSSLDSLHGWVAFMELVQ